MNQSLDWINSSSAGSPQIIYHNDPPKCTVPTYYSQSIYCSKLSQIIFISELKPGWWIQGVGSFCTMAPAGKCWIPSTNSWVKLWTPPFIRMVIMILSWRPCVAVARPVLLIISDLNDVSDVTILLIKIKLPTSVMGSPPVVILLLVLYLLPQS